MNHLPVQGACPKCLSAVSRTEGGKGGVKLRMMPYEEVNKLQGNRNAISKCLNCTGIELQCFEYAYCDACQAAKSAV